MNAPAHTAIGFEDHVATIPLDHLRESPWNPRQHWNQAQLEELARSIRAVGLLTPILARPVDKKGRPLAALDSLERLDHYEIAAGHRRHRAAKLAGVQLVPVQLRALTDEQFREILIIENLQRDDVHPLDEADAYDAILAHDKAYTVEAIAERVGKSTSYVYKRLKLLALCDKVREHYWHEDITAAHAERLARLTEKQQLEALEVCFYPIGRLEDRNEPQPVSRLDAWIERRVRVQLGAGETLPAEVQHYFPEVAAAIADQAEPAKILQLSASYQPGADLGTQKHGALGHGRWVEIDAKGYGNAKKRCANVQRGVIVHGGPMRLVDVCATKGCPTHWPVKKKGASSHAATPRTPDKWELDQQRRQREQKAWESVAPAFLATMTERGKQLTAEDVYGIVIDNLGVDTRHRKAAEKALGKLTATNFAAYAAFMLASDVGSWRGLADAKTVAKPFGANLADVEKAYKAELAKLTPKAEPKAAAKKAAKKR